MLHTTTTTASPLSIITHMHVPVFTRLAKATKPAAAPAPAPTPAARCFSIREGSIAWVVMSFFINHPEEELTSEDAGIKADATPRQVEQALAACVRDGYLATTEMPKQKRQQKPFLVYSAGHKLAAAAAHMHSINPNAVPRKPAGA